jgi:hypothetical protein
MVPSCPYKVEDVWSRERVSSGDHEDLRSCSGYLGYEAPALVSGQLAWVAPYARIGTAVLAP